MLFNLRLRPMRDILPIFPPTNQRPDAPEWERGPHMTWSSLTDGWYWIDAGGTELLRYSEAALELWTRAHRGEPWLERMADSPYVDEYVGRFWSEVLWLLPDVYAPVPPALASALLSDGAWTAWEHQAKATATQALPEGEAHDLLYDAMRWLGKRNLDASSPRPNIWFWSDGSDVHIQWDNREYCNDGIPVWEATLGQYILAVATFRDEVNRFNETFLRRMRDRAAMAQGEWSRPDVALDPQLAQSQLAVERWAQGYPMAGKQREPDDWDAVVAAIKRIQRLPEFDISAALAIA